MPDSKQPKVVLEQVKYTFTNEEKRVLGESLAREAQEVFSLRAQKKEVSSALAARIEEANGRVAATTDKINQGYEMRDAECVITFDVPRRGMKSYIRMDTHEAVREEAMTADELQETFAFTETGVLPPDEEAQPFAKRRGRPPKEVN
jgi:hypothetical protein